MAGITKPYARESIWQLALGNWLNHQDSCELLITELATYGTWRVVRSERQMRRADVAEQLAKCQLPSAKC